MQQDVVPLRGLPTAEERQKIRERADLVLAQARLLMERLDQSGGTVNVQFDTGPLSQPLSIAAVEGASPTNFQNALAA